MLIQHTTSHTAGKPGNENLIRRIALKSTPPELFVETLVRPASLPDLVTYFGHSNDARLQTVQHRAYVLKLLRQHPIIRTLWRETARGWERTNVPVPAELAPPVVQEATNPPPQ